MEDLSTSRKERGKGAGIENTRTAFNWLPKCLPSVLNFLHWLFFRNRAELENICMLENNKAETSSFWSKNFPSF